MSSCPKTERNPWLPFQEAEIEILLAVFGFVATLAAYAGVDERRLALGAVLYLTVAYFAGLLVQAHRARTSFALLIDGGLHGAGYVESFRQARRSLLLTHVDDDAPNEELQGLYRTLLERGVQMRRVVFLRSGALSEGVRWLRSFGDHANLLQRVMPEASSTSMCLSFVVVDAQEVIVAVPGFEPVDAEAYRDRLVFRHLLVIRDAAVAKAFVQMHIALWERAQPLPEAKALVATNRASIGKP